MSEIKDSRVKEWMDNIRLGLEYKDKYSSSKDWPKYREMYRGEVNGVPLPINRIYSYAKALLPRVYFRTPNITVTPVRPEFAAHAKVVESLDNWLIRELNLKYAIKRGSLNSYFTGVGPLKLGYDSEFGYINKDISDRDQGTASQVSKSDGYKIEYNNNINPGMPWCTDVRPEEIIVPFGSDDRFTLPWVCHLVIRPLDDVKVDSKYNPTVTKGLKGGLTPVSISGGKIDLKNLFSYMGDLSRLQLNDMSKFCLLYEIRDVKTGKILVICEDKVLLETEDKIMQVCGLPWEFISFNEDTENFWSVSDVKLILPQQDEASEIAIQRKRMRRQSILKFLYKQGVLRKEELTALLDTDIDAIGDGIEVQSDNISSDILPLQPRGLTNELNQDMGQVESDMRETIGFGRNQMGEMSPYHNKTAAEAQIVERASELRVDERRDVIADVISSIVRKFNQMIFSFWTTERVAEIAGPDGKSSWVTYTGDQLRGEYYLKIDPEAGLPISRGMRYNQSKELFEMLRDDPYIDQIALRKLLLQQTDWIDPTASQLVQAPQQPIGGPGMPPPQGPFPQGPIPFDQFAQGGR